MNLQVDVFCEEMCQAIESWLETMSGNKDMQQRLAGLLSIDDLLACDFWL